MSNFLLIGICLLAGWLVKRYTALPKDAHKGINAMVINLALPAAAFKYLPKIQWSEALVMPVLMPFVVWFGGWLYITAYARFAGLDKKTTAGLKLTTGLSNTSFVGFPLVTAYFGEPLLGIAVICDQVTFMLLSTAGIIVALNAADGHDLSLKAVLKKLLGFTPFLATIAALILPHFIDLSPFDPLFDKLTATVAPMALFSIGMQLRFDGWKSELQHISAALLYKLMIAPALVLLLAITAGFKGEITAVSVFESAMPSFITAGIIASQYQLNAKLSSLVVAVSILVSFLTTALWYWIIGQWV